ncbi:MAG: Rho termination factor N-terminal domain-containing protein [Desulfobacca sp.]|uniref:Rho termination factor N-terminal domain-containing protein n=1 Tax=Desulfobacca sp. TaxID=2067990 RepID=UPI0040496243
MTVREIRMLARKRGLKNYGRLKKAELIRALQVQEGNAPCFQVIAACGEEGCLWRTDCQGGPAP